MFMVGILFGFLPVYLYSIGYTPVESGSVVSVATLSYLLVQPLAGHLADKIDIAKTVFGGLLLAALAIIAVTFTARIPLIVVVIIAGIGIGTVWTNSDALVSTLVIEVNLARVLERPNRFRNLATWLGRYSSAPSCSGSVGGWDLSTAARWRWPVWSWLISRRLRRAEKLR